MDLDLKHFIESNQLLALATIDSFTLPWICNVYYSTNDLLEFYFISPENNNHSQHISNTPNIAFSVAWYDKNDLGNRKSIQGKGFCQKVEDELEIRKILDVHLAKYPDWKDSINFENIVNMNIESRVYKITPTCLKFWNDELYGDEGTKEFKFN